MESKQYMSFEQVERDLEILKLEREIHQKKIVLNIEKTKENLSPRKVVSGLLHFNIPNNLGSIVNVLSPILIHWFLNRKRGS